MALRGMRERMMQTLGDELGGLILVTPLYALAFGRGTGGSLAVMEALSAAVKPWSPLHNAGFDWAEFRFAGRVVSDRPQALRVVHAVSHETSSFALTTPILVWLGGHGWWEALVIDAALLVAYTAWAYAFKLVHDRLRPVAPPAVPPPRRRR